jgi:hypothetical protein
MGRNIPPRCKTGESINNYGMVSQKETAHNSTRAGLPSPMTVSKLLGSRSTTLEARAPARRDSEKIDKENFMKYVCSAGGTKGRKRRKKESSEFIIRNHHYIILDWSSTWPFQ